MRNKWLSVLMTLGLLLGVASVVPAQQPMPGGPDGAGPEMDGGPDRDDDRPMRHWMRELNLSEDQLAKLKAEQVKRQKEKVRLRADMETAHIDLWEEASKDQPDQGKIDRITKQMGELHAKVLSNRISSLTFLRAILTPEQKQKLDSMGAGMMGPERPRMLHKHKKRMR